MEAKDEIRQLEDKQKTLLQKRKSLKDSLDHLHYQGQSLGFARSEQALSAVPQEQEAGGAE